MLEKRRPNVEQRKNDVEKLTSPKNIQEVRANLTRTNQFREHFWFDKVPNRWSLGAIWGPTSVKINAKIDAEIDDEKY